MQGGETLSQFSELGIRQAYIEALGRLGKREDQFPNLLNSYGVAEAAVTRARDYFSSKDLPPCVDIIAVGSMGRFEMSAESDLDYLIVCSGEDDENDHDHTNALAIADGLRRVVIPEVELREPGSTGLFAKKVNANELYEVIGLEPDKNSTHSRRSLVIEESVSLRTPKLHEELLRTMISRYVDAIPLRQSAVPRFLVNDLARYWRQLTVDYQAKAENGTPSSIRRLKLIGPRKFTYAASVLPMLTLQLRYQRSTKGLDRAEIIDRLVEAFGAPPSLRFLLELEYLVEDGATPETVNQAFLALESLDKFNGLFSDPAWRQKVNDAATPEIAQNLEEFSEARALARTMQGALDALFFSERLQQLTRKYLVF